MALEACRHLSQAGTPGYEEAEAGVDSIQPAPARLLSQPPHLPGRRRLGVAAVGARVL